LISDPLESPCRDQAHNQKVIAPEAGGVLPGISIFIGPLKGNIEQGTFCGFLEPDAGTDSAMADFVNGLSVGCANRHLIFHDVLSVFGFTVRRKACAEGVELA
jgi:hypothetical protein